ncbi:MAG: tRNA pseudouridine(55) synthase TruB [Chloroflexi bacterium]|nr:tRNA pseudouridine(55) synthase TruB [Chloroflexota bacterium]
MDGILNIHKPLTLTSHDVVGRVRRVAGQKRVGHSGTLDPLATGVLVVCLGRATRLVEYVVGQRKEYEAVIRLGQSTATYDAEGEITAERPLPADLTADQLAITLRQFTGAIEQRPPMYSAIKKDGQPLYKMARRGETIEIPARPVTIYDLAILGWEVPLLTVRVACSAGTYIRSLAHDLGEVLGCGGHLVGLVRTAVGPFSLETAVALDALTPENIAQFLLPSETAVAHLPALELEDAAVKALFMGQLVPCQPHHPTAELVRVTNPNHPFAGLATREGEIWRPKKMFD